MTNDRLNKACVKKMFVLNVLDKTKKLLHNKFGLDLAYNYASLAVLAVSGVVINLVVVGSYGTQGLGVFNQVYSLWFITAQIAGFGVQFSVLKHVTQYKDKHIDRNQVIWSGLFTTLLLSGFVAWVMFHFAWVAGKVFDSREVQLAWRWALIGLAPYCVNKVILNVFMALRFMKLYSLTQSLRFIFLLVSVAIVCYGHYGVSFLGLSFAVAELVLLVFSFTKLWRHAKFSPNSINLSWCKKHLRFGCKGVFSGIFVEINARVDVLMLGYFLSDRIVGIYALAIMVATIFNYLLIVVRNNVTPLLVEPLQNGNTIRIKEIVSTLHRYIYPILAILAVIVISLYQPVVGLFMEPYDVESSWVCLIILLGGVVFYSGYMPLSLIFNQAGMPGIQTVFFGITTASNVLMNLILIPSYGIYGAAIATALSLVCFVLFLNVLVNRTMGFKLGHGFVKT